MNAAIELPPQIWLFMQIQKFMRLAPGLRFNEGECLLTIDHDIRPAAEIFVKRGLKVHDHAIPLFGRVHNKNLGIANFSQEILPVENEFSLLNENRVNQ